MSDLLIKNIELPLPCKQLFLFVTNDGTTYVSTLGDISFTETKATLVPPHGDLIDLSAKVDVQYYDDCDEEWSMKTVTVGELLDCCDEYPPTIIPASK